MLVNFVLFLVRDPLFDWKRGWRIGPRAGSSVAQANFQTGEKWLKYLQLNWNSFFLRSSNLFQSGVEYIRLRDNVFQFSKDFKLYMTSRLLNPHYLPEVSVKVRILQNFVATNCLHLLLVPKNVACKNFELLKRLLLVKKISEQLLGRYIPPVSHQNWHLHWISMCENDLFGFKLKIVYP